MESRSRDPPGVEGLQVVFPALELCCHRRYCDNSIVAVELQVATRRLTKLQNDRSEVLVCYVVCALGTAPHTANDLNQDA